MRLDDDGAVTEFVEKPSADQIDTNNISAGAYVLERSVLELLEPGKPASIERDVFPRLVGDGLYGYVGEGYWMDIGTPERYLQGTFDILEGTVAHRGRGAHGRRLTCASTQDVENAGPDHPVGAGRERLPDRRAARGSAAGWCSSAASRSARARPSSARSCCEGADDRRGLHAARLHRRRAACAIGDDCMSTG